MKFTSFYIVRPAANKWEAVSSSGSRLGGTSFKRKRDLVEVIESRFYGEMRCPDIAIVAEKNWRVK